MVSTLLGKLSSEPHRAPHRAPVHKLGLHPGFVLERAARVHGATPLVLDHDLDVLPQAGRRLTVRQVARHVADLANRMVAAGVRRGSRVVICKAPNFDIWLLATAVERTGAVPVLLSRQLDSGAVAALLARLGRPYLVTDGPTLRALTADGVEPAELTRGVIGVGDAGPGAVAIARLDGAAPAVPMLRGLDEPAMITHTSGARGLPELVVHTPRTLRAGLRPRLFLPGLTRKRGTVAIHLPFGDPRTFAVLALCLRKGMPALLVNDGTPGAVAGLFAQHRPWLIETLPGSVPAWEGLAADPRGPFASVKHVSGGSDAIRPTALRRLLGSRGRRTRLSTGHYDARRHDGR